MTTQAAAGITQKLTELLDRFSSAVAAGGDVGAVFDRVMGEGAYDRLVSDIYDDLRAKAA